MYIPSERSAGEESPFMLSTQHGRSIVAGIHRQQITLFVVIIDSSEITQHNLLRQITAHMLVIGNRIQRRYQVGQRTISTGRHTVARLEIVGITSHDIQMMICKVFIVCQYGISLCLPPFRITGTSRAHSIQVVHTILVRGSKAITIRSFFPDRECRRECQARNNLPVSIEDKRNILIAILIGISMQMISRVSVPFDTGRKRTVFESIFRCRRLSDGTSKDTCFIHTIIGIFTVGSTSADLQVRTQFHFST